MCELVLIGLAQSTKDAQSKAVIRPYRSRGQGPDCGGHLYLSFMLWETPQNLGVLINTSLKQLVTPWAAINATSYKMVTALFPRGYSRQSSSLFATTVPQ